MAPSGPQITPATASPDTLQLYGYLPQFAQDGDAAGGYVLLSWLEGAVNPVAPGTVPTACAGLQQIDDLVRDSQYGTGWSSVMDVGRCPNYALLWLAQFVGVNVPGSLIGTTPANDSAMRQAIIAKNAFARGTPGAIQAAAAAVLGPGGSVNIIERYPDPYSLTIQYFDSAGGLTYAQLAAADPTYTAVATAYPFYDDFPISAYGAIQAAILAAIPAGLVATVVAG